VKYLALATGVLALLACIYWTIDYLRFRSR
jgi:hypothetical protein